MIFAVTTCGQFLKQGVFVDNLIDEENFRVRKALESWHTAIKIDRTITENHYLDKQCSILLGTPY